MASIQFSGLSSGLDSQKIIEALMQAERQPVVRLEQRRTLLDRQRSVLSDLISRLQAVQTKAQSLDTLSEFFSYSAKSSDSNVVAATASGSALPGTFGITVSQLAAAERTYSDAFASSTTAGLVTAGTLGITVGTDTQVNVAIDASDSLTSIANKINSSGARVVASVLKESDTSYRLVVSGKDTGSANAITFSDPTNLNLDVVANEKQAAVNSTFQVDGLTISRATNLVSDALTGVTLDLRAVSASAVTVTIAADTDSIRDKVQQFVSAYNDAARLISDQFKYTGTAKGEDSLVGDSAVRNALLRMQRILSTTISGLTGQYNSAAEVGFKTNKDGTLTLDSTQFDAAIAKDTRGVGLVFAKEGSTTGIASQFDTLLKSLTESTGSLGTRKSGLDTRITRIDKDIEAMEFRLERYEFSLQQQYMNLERVMATLQQQTSALTNMNSRR